MDAKRKLLTLHDLYLLGVMALIGVADRAGSPALSRLFARIAGLTSWWLSRRRRQGRAQQVARILDLDESETRRIVKNCFYQFWDGVFLLRCHWRLRSTSCEVQLRGLENLQKALAKGKGAILWESHSFGMRVLAKRILHASGLSITQLHGRNHLEGFHNSKSWVMRKIIYPFVEQRERAFVKEIIYLTPSEFSFNRTLLERLKGNGILCVAADGRQGHRFVSVEYLGTRQLFSSGMVSLARLSGASLLPMFCIQDETEKPTLIIEPPIDVGIERNAHESVSRYVRLLEGYIRRYPEQFRWHGAPGEGSPAAAPLQIAADQTVAS